MYVHEIAHTIAIPQRDNIASGVRRCTRKSNARVERPAAAQSGARTAQNEWRAGRALK